MKNWILAILASVALLAPGCSRPPPPEGAGRATTAPNSPAQEAGGSANTTKNMGATPVSPGAEKAQPTGK